MQIQMNLQVDLKQTPGELGGTSGSRSVGKRGDRVPAFIVREKIPFVNTQFNNPAPPHGFEWLELYRVLRQAVDNDLFEVAELALSQMRKLQRYNERKGIR
jgi:hypothetical protein